MSMWKPEPPQGNTTEQGLSIIGRPIIPQFGAPQGIAGVVIPPVANAWIDDLGNSFVDDLGNNMVFDP